MEQEVREWCCGRGTCHDLALEVIAECPAENSDQQVIQLSNGTCSAEDLQACGANLWKTRQAVFASMAKQNYIDSCSARTMGLTVAGGGQVFLDSRGRPYCTSLGSLFGRPSQTCGDAHLQCFFDMCMDLSDTNLFLTRSDTPLERDLICYTKRNQCDERLPIWSGDMTVRRLCPKTCGWCRREELEGSGAVRTGSPVPTAVLGVTVAVLLR